MIWLQQNCLIAYMMTLVITLCYCSHFKEIRLEDLLVIIVKLRKVEILLNLLLNFNDLSLIIIYSWDDLVNKRSSLCLGFISDNINFITLTFILEIISDRGVFIYTYTYILPHHTTPHHTTPYNSEVLGFSVLTPHHITLSLYFY